jgi:DNA-directed RNA polymerase subunit beta
VTKPGDAKDASLKAPSGTEGVVIDKKLFQRAKKDKNAKVREKAQLEKVEKRITTRMLNRLKNYC